MSNQSSTTSSQSKTLGWRGLGGTMSALTLLISLIPLITVAIVVVIALSTSIGNLEEELLATRQQMAQEVVGTSLQGEAGVTMNAIDAYLQERLQNAIEWANAPIIRQAAKEGTLKAEEMGLVSMSVEQIENRMDATRALNQDSELETYLADMSRRIPAFIEIFFTEKNGFNVAYNNMTSDFVQSGEGWWDEAWATGSFIGFSTWGQSQRRAAAASSRAGTQLTARAVVLWGSCRKAMP